MKILAIETSCDDTCVAVSEIKNKKLKILSNIVSSQIKLHKKYGGVYPLLAKREHQRNLPLVLKRSLKGAGNPKIDLIAVTTGPGLEPCLWTGINFAGELAEKLKLPLLPINHVEAHILANFIGEKSKVQKYLFTGQTGKIKNIFPAVCLIVSGGHTQLILMKNVGKYRILGETRDDAAGECFDKTARILGLEYPGGPAIAKKAQQYNLKIKNRASKRSEGKKEGNSLFGHLKLKISLPRPMIYQKNYDFSFSGLKTAVLYDFKKRPSRVKISKQYVEAMANEIQQAIIDVLIRKTIVAAKDYKVKSIILSGGVAANQELRNQFEKKVKKLKIDFLVPPKNLCTDNAAMIAVTAYCHLVKKGNKIQKEIRAKANLRIS